MLNPITKVRELPSQEKNMFKTQHAANITSLKENRQSLGKESLFLSKKAFLQNTLGKFTDF